MSALRYSIVLALSTSACMLSPTDDKWVTNTWDPLTFSGYTTRAGAPVQVRAWDFQANAMVNVGGAVAAGSTSTHSSPALFGWQAVRTLAPRHWRAGPFGGMCAVVGARTVVDGRTVDVMTVEPDWYACYDEHPSAEDFYQHCGSSNSPVAKLYTRSWGTTRVGPSELAIAAFDVSSRLRLVLDNYTPTAYAFCRAGNPGGCPPGLGADPELYKFYQPAASSLTRDGDTVTLSITPWRDAPMTIYVDDLRSRSFTFSVSDGRLVLGIDFESAGVEIHENCVRDAACATSDGRTVDLRSPRVSAAFELAIEGGRVGYDDVITSFRSDTSGNEAARVGDLIARAVRDALISDARVRSSMSAALHAALVGAADLDGFPVEWLSFDATGVTLLPGCPMD